MQENLSHFLDLSHLAVFGADPDAASDGYRLVGRLEKAGYQVYPINPRCAECHGLTCYGSLDEIPHPPQGVVIALHPEATLEVLRASFQHGVRRFWLQPGSESEEVDRFGAETGAAVVSGCCLLEALDRRGQRE
jgi:predicted CoA-binding protein